MAASHLNAGELQRKKAVGGRVGRAGHTGEEIRVGDQVYGARLGVRGGAEDCERFAGRLCLGVIAPRKAHQRQGGGGGKEL